jgi:hypothetical protein
MLQPFDGWDRIVLLGYPCLDRNKTEEALNIVARELADSQPSVAHND